MRFLKRNSQIFFFMGTKDEFRAKMGKNGYLALAEIGEFLRFTTTLF